MAGIERQGPAIINWQAVETRHRGSVETLGDHLIEAEHAALGGTLGVGERDRRGIQLCGLRPMTVAGFAMAGRTVLAEHRRAAR
jgi:hypothetical protein